MPRGRKKKEVVEETKEEVKVVEEKKVEPKVEIKKEPKKDEDGTVIVEEPKSINDTTPLYTKNPHESTDEEYKDFYRKTFNDFKEPLF